jgi:hypothetical protein
MDKLIDFFIRIVGADNWYRLAVLVLIVAAIKSRDIFGFAKSFRNRKVKALAEALKHSELTGAARALVEEELNQLLVRNATGIAANKATREKIQELIESSKGEIPIRLFAGAGNRLLFVTSVLVTGMDARLVAAIQAQGLPFIAGGVLVI